MQPVTVKSQLDFKTFYNLNMYLLYRKRFMWIFGFLCLIMIGVMIYRLMNPDYDSSTSLWAGGFLCLYYLLMPLLIYRVNKRSFKKIQSMAEAKTYHFDDEHIKLESETLNMTSNWSPIERVRERKNDFLLVTTGGRSVHYLPKNGFDNEAGIFAFRELILRKGLKNNLK